MLTRAPLRWLFATLFLSLTLGTSYAASATGIEPDALFFPVDDNTICRVEQPSNLVTFTAVQDGSWFDPNTWDLNAVPGDDDSATIPAGRTVTYDGVSAVALMNVTVFGTLTFSPTVDTHMRVDTITSYPGSLLQLGSAATPVAPDVETRISIVDRGPINMTFDPSLISRGVVTYGVVEMVGADKLDFVPLVGDALAGDTSLILDLPAGMTTPDGWRVGDQLVIGGTDYNPAGSNADNSRFQDEVLTITAINGNQISFTNNDITDGDNTVLRFDHVREPGFESYDLKIYVANLTRNIVIETENPELVPTQQRGHVMHHVRTVEVHNVLHLELGRTDKEILVDDPPPLGGGTNARARYPLHFHRNGAHTYDGGPARATGNVIVGSPGWGIVHHDSYVELEDNVVFDVLGSAIVAEAGNEIGHWINNIAIKTTGDSNPSASFFQSPRIARFDLGFNGEAYWVQGAAQTIMIDNIAISAAGGGMNIFSGQDDNFARDVGKVPVGVLDPAMQHIVTDPNGLIDVTHVPLRQLSGFVVSNSAFGLQIWNHMRNDDGENDFVCPQCDPNDGYYNDHDVRAVIDDFQFWGIYREGVFMEYSTQVDLVNGLIVGDPDTPVPYKAGFAGDGYGHGISSNTGTINIRVDNVWVEGFARGARPSYAGARGEEKPYLATQFTNMTFDNNLTVFSMDNNSFEAPIAFPAYTVIDNLTVLNPHGTPPVAAFTATSLGDVGVVKLDGGDSYDPEAALDLGLSGNGIVGYAWDVDGDTAADYYGRDVHHAFTTPGPHAVTLTVYDHMGDAASVTRNINTVDSAHQNALLDSRFDASTPFGANGFNTTNGRAGDGWIAMNMQRQNGAAVVTAGGYNVGLAQVIHDRWERRGPQRLELDLYNVEGSDPKPNEVRVRIFGIDGQFDTPASDSDTVRPSGSLPMTYTTILTQDVFPGTIDWTTFGWDVDFGDGFQYILVLFEVIEPFTSTGDVIRFDNIYLGDANRPLAADDEKLIVAGTGVVIDALANDHDFDDSSLTIIGATDPEFGYAVVQNNELFYAADSALFTGFDSFEYTVSDSSGYTATARVDILADRMQPQGLITWYPMDEGYGRELIDHAPDGAFSDDTAISGMAPSWTTGFSGHALQFDGGFAVAPLPSSDDIIDQPFRKRTIALRFKADDVSVSERRQFLFEHGGANLGLAMYLWDGNLYFGGKNTNVGWNEGGTWIVTDTVSSGEWYHVALVLDAPALGNSPTGLRAYLNGELVAAGVGYRMSSTFYQAAIGNFANDAIFHDGAFPGFFPVHGFAGAIDDVRIYDRVLSDIEIRALAEDPEPTAVAQVGLSATTMAPGGWVVLGAVALVTTSMAVWQRRRRVRTISATLPPILR